MDLFPETLLRPAPLRLVDDAEGGIWYRPGVVAEALAQRWYEALRAEVPWAATRRPMYDRVVDVPRLVSSYPIDGSELPAALAEALAAVRQHVGEPFNAVGLNLYRHAQDSVAPHNDTLHALAPGQPIAILSLGDVRDMVIRPKPGVAGRVVRIPLQPGSLLVMSHASQFTHDHGVPKSRAPVGPRISLAFRVCTGRGMP